MGVFILERKWKEQGRYVENEAPECCEAGSSCKEWERQKKVWGKVQADWENQVECAEIVRQMEKVRERKAYYFDLYVNSGGNKQDEQKKVRRLGNRDFI